MRLGRGGATRQQSNATGGWLRWLTFTLGLNMNKWIIVATVLGIFLILMLYDRFVPRFQGTQKLRGYLRNSDFLHFRNALKELKRRGEDIREEVVPILHLLVSDDRRQRIVGWLILKEIYPELASRVPTFNPHENSDICKEKMRGVLLQAAQPEAAPNGGPAELLANSGVRGGPPSVS